MYNSPYLRQNTSVRRVMTTVLVAMLPAIAVQSWLFGTALLVQIALASATALACEALVLALRNRPVAPALTDMSALVTAWLIAVCLPPLLPWWTTVLGTAFALIIGKHLYGGLGQNPFNPAMLAYALLIVSFPALMSQWPGLNVGDFATQMDWVFGGARALDGVTGATPLDALRTGLMTGGDTAAVMNSTVFGHVAGAGWEWVALAWGAGGVLLLALRIITWQGRCEVHERFTAADVASLKQSFPGALILAHPECPPDVLAAADYAGSTAALADWVETHAPAKVVLLTECSMSDNVAQSSPNTEFVRPCNLCPHMKRITLASIYECLRDLRHVVDVPAPVADRARIAIERMLALPPSARPAGFVTGRPPVDVVAMHWS